MKRNYNILKCLLFILAISVLAVQGLLWAAPMTSTNYSVDDDVLAGGGEVSASTNYSLYDTVGEPFVGDDSSTNYKGSGGFIALVINVASLPDVTAPTTAISPSFGVYSAFQSVSLNCNDGSGSGCDKTWFCEGLGCTPSTQYSSAFDVTSSIYLRYYSKDIDGNTESVAGGAYTIKSDPMVYTGGDSGDGVNDSLRGINRSDGGDDSSNTSSGKAKIDLDYTFSIAFYDDSGETPQVEPKLYLAHKGSPSASDFYVYGLTCTGATWAAGKTCGIDIKLGPAAAHRYYFYAKKTDGTEVRLPPSGYLGGPTVNTISGWSMVAAARDIDSAGLSGSSAFNRGTVYKWVSNGLDTVYNTTFDGYWAAVSSAKKGEAYFISGGSATLPELAAYNDYTTANFDMDLQPGWNMIGNPYNGNVTLSDIEIKQDAGTFGNWTTATNSNWVYDTLWYYNGSDWGGTWNSTSAWFGGSTDAVLVPWLGYWIYMRDDVSAYELRIPKPAQ